jgi:hypothetical protein
MAEPGRSPHTRGRPSSAPIYEMRFDEASSWYGEFGPFLVGLQFSASDLGRFLEGRTPAHNP